MQQRRVADLDLIFASSLADNWTVQQVEAAILRHPDWWSLTLRPSFEEAIRASREARTGQGARIAFLAVLGLDPNGE